MFEIFFDKEKDVMDKIDEIMANWMQIKGKLKQQFSELTDDDLLYKEGEEDILIGRLQKKLNMTHTEVIKKVKELDIN